MMCAPQSEQQRAGLISCAQLTDAGKQVAKWKKFSSSRVYSDVRVSALDDWSGSVLVKQLRPDAPIKPGVTGKAVVSRAASCVSINSPRLVATHGVGAVEDSLSLESAGLVDGMFVVESSVLGTSLRELLMLKMSAPSRKLCRSDDALRWAYQIARGLWELHRAGTVHGDVRAGTVLLAGIPPGCSPKAKDLTQSNAMLSDVCIGGLLDLSARAQSVLGSDAGNCVAADDDLVVYVAPEVLRGSQASAASDVYSFGFVLGELMSGQISFMALCSRIDGLNLPCFMSKVANEGCRPPMPESLPPSLAAIMKACWHKDSNARPTMAEVLVCLDAHIRPSAQPLPPWLLCDTQLSAVHSSSNSRMDTLNHNKEQAAASQMQRGGGSGSGTGTTSLLMQEPMETAALSDAKSPTPRSSIDLHSGLLRPSLRFYSVDQTTSAFQRFTSKHWISPAELKVMSRNAKQVAQGAFAGVVRARMAQPGGTVTVAIKALKKDQLCEEQSIKDFMWECSLLCELNHPSIARVIGVGSDEELRVDGCLPTNLYLVQEYMEGGDLKGMLTKQMATPTHRLYKEKDALRWGLQMARGLRALHTASPMVIHRDLKPENVLLSSKQLGKANTKLIDFGLHVLIKQDRTLQLATDTALLAAAPACPVTQPARGGLGAACCQTSLEASGSLYPTMSDGTMERFAGLEEYGISAGDLTTYQLTGLTGSLLYMAPEVYSNQDYNEKVDVFSFGVILFELLTHELSYYALNARHEVGEAQEYVQDICLRGWRPPIPPRVPKDLQHIITRCWAQQAVDRPSMVEVVELIKAAMESRGLPNCMPPAQLRKCRTASTRRDASSHLPPLAEALNGSGSIDAVVAKVAVAELDGKTAVGSGGAVPIAGPPKSGTCCIVM